MKKYLIITCCLVFSLFLITSCNNQNNNNENNNKQESVQEIVIGGNMPNLKVKNLGLGQLYKMDIPKEDMNFYKGISCYDVQKFNNEDKTKSFSVMKEKNSDNITLEEHIQKRMLTDFPNADSSVTSNWRVANSETYEYDNVFLKDGFYVSFVTLPSGDKNIRQNCTFLDGDEFVHFSFNYKCNKTQVGNSDVYVNIPILHDAKVVQDTKGDQSTKYSFEDITELPDIILSESDSTVDNVIEEYKTKYNATSENVKVNNTDCVVLKVNNVSNDNTTYNTRTYLFQRNNKLVKITFAEKSSNPTYSFDAFEKAIQIDK